MAGLRLIAILFLISAATGLSAQQLSLFTQYRENLTVINPAAVESDYLVFGQNMTFGASYRNQWVGLEGSPTTQVARFSYLADGMSGVALMGGAHILNDATGPTGLTGFYGRLAGILTDDPAYGGFVVGLSAGYVQYRVNGSEIVFREAENGVGAVDQSQMYPDLGVGIYFYKNVGRYGDDMFYTGVSIPQVFGLDLTFQNDNGEFTTQRVQHVYATAGFYKFFDNDSFLEPSVWIKYAPNAPTNIDVNLRYQLPSTLWIGAGVSSASNVHLETGIILGENVGMINSTLRFGYGFDYSFSSFGPSAGNTHELNVTYSFAQ